MLLSTGTAIIPPILLAQIVDEAIPQRDIGLAVILALAAAAIGLLGLVFVLLEEYFRAVIGEAVTRRLRERAFLSVLRSRVGDLELISPQDIVFRLTRSCGRVGEWYVSTQIMPLFSNAILFTGLAVTIIVMDWALAIVLLISVPVLQFIAKVLQSKSREMDRELHGIHQEGERYLREAVDGLRTIRSLNGTGFEQSRWQQWIRKHWSIKARAIVLHDLVLAHLSPIAVALATSMAFGFGTFRVVEGSISVGSLIAVISFIPRIYTSLNFIIRAQVGTARITEAYDRVDHILLLPSEPSQYSGERRGSSGRSRNQSRATGTEIRFRDVSFSYPRGDIGVQRLSLDIRVGEFVAIVGPTGGGKSTIIDLIMGFYKPQCGEVIVDGVELWECDIDDVRKRIALVPQDPFLWDADVLSNIIYPRDRVSDDALDRSVRAAQARELISQLPEAYETRVGDRGSHLSSGERQRIAIARALFRDAELLLLDEVSSALDAATEAELRLGIQSVRGRATVVMIAHRLRMVLDADRVFVVEDGAIVESGPPQRLLDDDGAFARLYRAQTL